MSARTLLLVALVTGGLVVPAAGALPRATPGPPGTARRPAPVRASEDAAELSRQAQAEIDAGRPEVALEHLLRALALSPDDEVLQGNVAWAAYLCGQAARERGDLRQALPYYARAWEQRPDQAAYGLHVVELQVRLHDLDAALDTADALVAGHPDDARGHLRRAETLLLLDRLDESVEAYERGLQAAGDDAALVASSRAGRQRAQRQAAVEADYLTLRSDTFVLRHPPGTDLPSLLAVLEQARVQARSALGLSGRGPLVRVVLYPPDAFREATGSHDWVGGLYDRKIRLPIADPRSDAEAIRSTFRHEYVHLLVADWNAACPTVLNEGLAQRLEWGGGDGMDRLAALLDAQGISRDEAPHLADLPATFVTLTDRREVERAYGLSYAFVDHVAAFHGPGAVIDWIREARPDDLAGAYERGVGGDLAREEARFRELLRTHR